jgi:hypothetical protein
MPTQTPLVAAHAVVAVVSDADLHVPLGDAPISDRGATPCPPDIAAIKLSIAETNRLARPA